MMAPLGRCAHCGSLAVERRPMGNPPMNERSEDLGNNAPCRACRRTLQWWQPFISAGTR
jgi:hypothetical protein